MKCAITITRSDSWVKSQRLATGENTPTEIKVDVDVSQLSESARCILLEYNSGSYPNTFDGSFDERRKLNRCTGYGRVHPAVDSLAPTVAEIDAAICQAAADVEAKRAEYEAEKAAREAAEWERRRLENERLEALKAARELLKGEIDALTEQYNSVRKDRRILADFLSEVPQDALRGTAKAIASNGDALEALMKSVEDASPVVIFSEDDDSDE